MTPKLQGMKFYLSHLRHGKGYFDLLKYNKLEYLTIFSENIYISRENGSPVAWFVTVLVVKCSFSVKVAEHKGPDFCQMRGKTTICLFQYSGYFHVQRFAKFHEIGIIIKRLFNGN